MSIAGNAGRTTYNVALNFVDQPGTLKGFDYQKYNATVDLTSQITDFIKIGTYTNLMYGDRDEPRQGQSDVLLSTMSQAPTYMLGCRTMGQELPVGQILLIHSNLTIRICRLS